jgi:hypothetical protein
MFGCESIFVEYLKGLKSKTGIKDLNWRVNTTVRQAIYDLVDYKAKLCGVKLGASPIGSVSHLPCESVSLRKRLHRNLNGWRKAVFLSPWFFASTLHIVMLEHHIPFCVLLVSIELQDKASIRYFNKFAN